MSNKKDSFSKTFFRVALEPNLYHRKTRKSSLREHPFIFLQEIILEQVFYSFTDYQPASIHFASLRNQEEKAWDNFLFELVMSSRSDIYLNAIVIQIFSIQKDCRFKLNEEILSQDSGQVNLNLNFCTQSCDRILQKFFSDYSYLLNQKNKEKLSLASSPVDTVKSFRFTKNPDPSFLRILFEEHLLGKFIDSRTSYAIFRTMFDGKDLVEKINWIGDKASLYYFIKQLCKSGVVENPKNKHWRITAEFFLIKGRRLSRQELANHKPPTNKGDRRILFWFVTSLQSHLLLPRNSVSL